MVERSSASDDMLSSPYNSPSTILLSDYKSKIVMNLINRRADILYCLNATGGNASQDAALYVSALTLNYSPR